MNIGPYVVTDPDCVADGVVERFRVRHRVLLTPHILELLASEAARDEATVTAFITVARARAALRHRNLVGVEHCGRTRDGRWFVVAEALDGRTLAELVRGCGAVPHTRALEIVAQLANAIEAAYTRGVAPAALVAERIALSTRAGNPYHPTVLGLRTGIVDPVDDGRALAIVAWQLVTGELAVEPGHEPAIPSGWLPILRATIGRARELSPRGLVLALAEATPAEVGDGPHGIELVRVHARELLEIGSLTETVRAPARPRAVSRYRRGERLGVGGMAEVFRGTTLGAEGFARPIAIKCVLSHLSEAPEFARMFVAEAKIASRLAHPNIVAVHDFDRDADDRLFLVMELVDGVALDALAATGPVPAAIARFVAVEALRGLGHAHASPDGVVHRDVTPHNILVSWDGAVKVTDFGIAKVRTASAHSTRLRGKPGYLAPEQVAGGPIDGRADLFAAGVVLWELVTGTRLSVGARLAHAALPAALEAIVTRLLAPDPADRYATAAAAITALVACPLGVPRDERVALGELLARRFTRREPSPRTQTQTVTRAYRRRPSPAPRRTRAWLLVIVLGALLGIGLGAVIGLG